MSGRRGTWGLGRRMLWLVMAVVLAGTAIGAWVIDGGRGRTDGGRSVLSDPAPGVSGGRTAARRPVPSASGPASAAPRLLMVAPALPLGSVAGIPGGPHPLPRGAVALTFDDGPDPVWTAQVLAVLARFHARATFFDIGYRVAEYPQLARDEYLAGNGVASHTFSHPDLTTLSPAALNGQLADADAAIAAATGHQPVCMRPPYNAFDERVEEATALDHEALVSYDLDPRDWARPGTAAIVAAVLDRVHAGSVVDLHDAGGDRSQTLAALPGILTGLAARGLVSVPLCR